MNRKSALIAAGFLTAVATILVFTLTTSAITQASAQTSDDPNLVTAVQPGQNAEATWPQQASQDATALESLDGAAQAQIGQFQSLLAGLETEISSRAAAVEALQAELQQTQQAIAQDDLTYQDRLATLQADNMTQDALLRQQIDDTLTQLQGAYGEIAQRQSAQYASSGQSSLAYNDHEGQEEHEDHQDRGDRYEHDDD